MQQHPLRPFIENTAAAAKLAGEAQCSVSHLLNIGAGRKTASLPLAKRLSEATGLKMEVFIGKQLEAAE
jgi:nucleoside-diphosphate-sugar epimerase